MKTMAHTDKAHSPSTKFSFYKISPLSTPKPGNLRWINNGCKSNSQSHGESKMAA